MYAALCYSCENGNNKNLYLKRGGVLLEGGGLNRENTVVEFNKVSKYFKYIKRDPSLKET